MKKILILMVVLGLTFGLTAFAKSETKGKPQTKCPICKMDINKNLYVDYKGKRVYFGCEGCPAEFKKNPEKYIRQMEKEGIVLEKAPAKDSKMMKMNMMKNKDKNHANCKMNKKDKMMMMKKDAKENCNMKMNKKTETSKTDKKCTHKKMMMEEMMKNKKVNTNTNTDKEKK